MNNNDKSVSLELIQYYFNFILQLSESDRREIEERGEQYISWLKAARDKLLAGIGFIITVLLALASMNVMPHVLLVISLFLIGVGIVCFFIADILTRRASMIFLRIKAARYKPILILMQLIEYYLTLMLEVIMTPEHHRVFLKYLKLASYLKTELIEEYKRASNSNSLLTEKYYYNSLRKTEELMESQALDYYLSNKDELVKDEIIQSYEASLARAMGGETILQRYERLAANRTPVIFENKEHGIEMTFPND